MNSRKNSTEHQPRIKQVATIKGRIGWHGLRTDDFVAEGNYLITGTDFKDGKVDFSDTRFVDDSAYERDPNIQLRRGDVLLTKDGTIGKVALIDDLPGPATLNSGVFVVRPQDSNLLPRFLFWLLTSPLLLEFVRARASGSTINHLYQEVFREFSLPLPSLGVQGLIADFLDREAHRIDALAEAKRRMIDLIAEKRRSVVSHVIADSGGPLARVRHAVSSITSGSRGWAAYYADEGRPFIRISNVSAEGIELNVSDLIRVQPPPSKERARTEARIGDVVVSITADVGSVAVVEDPSLLPCHISQHVALLRLRELALPRYLAYCMTTSAAQAAFDAARYGGTKTQLALDDVLDIPIRLPDTSVQAEVVSRLDRDTSVAEAAIQALTRQLDLLAEYRQALITQAVTGQLDEATLKGEMPVDEVVGVIPG